MGGNGGLLGWGGRPDQGWMPTTCDLHSQHRHELAKFAAKLVGLQLIGVRSKRMQRRLQRHTLCCQPQQHSSLHMYMANLSLALQQWLANMFAMLMLVLSAILQEDCTCMSSQTAPKVDMPKH